MKLNPVNCRHGAPMGREQSLFALYNGAVIKARLFRMDLDAGGYDNGGAYWGVGKPIYVMYAPALWAVVRANSREDAARLFRADNPHCTLLFRGIPKENANDARNSSNSPSACAEQFSVEVR